MVKRAMNIIYGSDLNARLSKFEHIATPRNFTLQQFGLIISLRAKEEIFVDLLVRPKPHPPTE